MTIQLKFQRRYRFLLTSWLGTLDRQLAEHCLLTALT
jgi:hypothetical protein